MNYSLEEMLYSRIDTLYEHTGVWPSELRITCEEYILCHINSGGESLNRRVLVLDHPRGEVALKIRRENDDNK